MTWSSRNDSLISSMSVFSLVLIDGIKVCWIAKDVWVFIRRTRVVRKPSLLRSFPSTSKTRGPVSELAQRESAKKILCVSMVYLLR
jgi:hypothetical protein